MAITSIKNSFSRGAFRLRLPRRLRSTATSRGSGSGGGEIVSPKTANKEDGFRQVFRYLDADDDGKISADELRAYFASVGDAVSPEDAEKIIKELSKGGDAEDSSMLGFTEFVRAMEFGDSGGDDNDVVLRQAFEVYEVDKGSGCITAEGLRRVLRRLGEVKSREECEAMIGFYDLDGNGVLDFHEFYKMMT
ncbi:hypothetical protein BUALT_Bualt01G0035300 [Buddleja alternifolia]|uniref:EF-hand domain-containing protein n=1 Tax=Buddleja alternifolia TaxID=168488 RepID=A0AAV6Y8A4_9LAMI|nr:hypothetical protein BUALT_Bualt01G0035300 [Buddleja alternifolia]